MKPFLLVLAAVVAASALGSSTAPARAAERVENLQLPFYARLDPFYFGNEEWSAITFYRPPECIPVDFNLLVLFDVPRVFGCGPQTVEGFGIFNDGPPPIQQQMHGLGAVPIWFTRTEVAQAALADGVLTMGELESLDPLEGLADVYTEVLHPSRMFAATARGTLEDGRSFFLSFAGNSGGGDWKANLVVRFSY